MILRTPEEIQGFRKRNSDASIGFVPTMGALHAGHAELLNRARQENDLVVLSIFVNPTQFNDPKDFEHYPSTWDSDLALAENAGVHAIFAPEAKTLYADQFRYQISENQDSLGLCGGDRPGHFTGVLTVVMKLLNLVQPTRAYFGEKDFQQLLLVKGMVQAFYLPYEICPVATVRETDGLAMSSRNLRLTPSERALAPSLNAILRTSKTATAAAQSLTEAGFRVDYVEDKWGRRFAAAHLGSVRLIDNIPWTSSLELGAPL